MTTTAQRHLLMCLWSGLALLDPRVSASCWERRICCPGRNVSCASTDSESGWHLHMDSKVKMPPGYHLEDFFEGLYTAQKRLATRRKSEGLDVDFNEELMMVTTEEPSAPRRRTKQVLIDVHRKQVDFVVTTSTTEPPSTSSPPERGGEFVAMGIGEIEEGSGEQDAVNLERFANLRLDNLNFVLSDGSNVSAATMFQRADESATPTVAPVVTVVSAKYGGNHTAATTSGPQESLKLIFDDSGDFISIEKHIVNDTQEWIIDEDPRQIRSGQRGVASSQMQGDQPRSDSHPRTALDSVISYVVVDDHLLPENLEKFQKLQEYLGRKPKGKTCYCDAVCAALKDCCRDYDAVCPAVNCRVGGWSEWSGCEVTGENDLQPSEKACGEGISRRTRVVLESSDNGGAECPVLEEKRGCFKAGPPCNEGVSEVAMLLPHKYGAARVPGQKNNVYYDIPKVTAKYNDMNSYCIHFHVSWVNPQCSDTATRDAFSNAEQICVECQPTAQLAKERCVGEGATGARTLWTVFNSPQCFGFWTRVDITTKCSCNETSQAVPAFIFV